MSSKANIDFKGMQKILRKVTGPDDVVEQMKKAASEFADNYK